MGEMRIIDATGDSRTIWDPDNQDEVDAAEAQFKALVKDKKYQAFTVKKDGEKGKMMKTFDPNAGKMILTPRFAGG